MEEMIMGFFTGLDYSAIIGQRWSTDNLIWVWGRLCYSSGFHLSRTTDVFQASVFYLQYAQSVFEKDQVKCYCILF